MRTELLNNQEEQNTDVIIDEQLQNMEEAIELEKEFTLDLNDIEPQAGIPDKAMAEVTIALKPLQSVEPIEIEDIDDIGPIDETEAGFQSSFSKVESNYASAGNYNDVSAFLIAQNNVNPVLDALNSIFPAPSQAVSLPVVISPPALPQAAPTPPQAMIKVSNATTNQNTINDNDHYELEFQKFSKNESVDAQTMDINSVPSDAIIQYNFKSETKFNARLKTDWNDVKNIDVESEDLTHVTLNNFVHTDAKLTHEDGVILRIRDAKRGFIETGEGDDNINIKAFTNGSGWSNRFEIDSAGGDDVLTLRGSKGHTLFDVDAGDGNDIVRLRGDYESSNVDLGHGNDRFNGRDGDDVVIGDHGSDVIRGRAGNDLLIGGSMATPNFTQNATQVDFEFIKSIAGYKNTFGAYEIAEDGTITNVSIIFENVKANPKGTTETVAFEGDANIATFIIANGYNKNGRFDNMDFDNGDLNFIFDFGGDNQRLANINDDADTVSLIYTGMDGVSFVLKGYDYHGFENLNHDGKDHIQEVSLNETTQILNFEDLPNLGDRDFRDVVIEMETTPLYDADYEAIINDNDVLRGDQGNDILIGGAGDDKLFGGQDIDIAVFMGTIDEYVISQKGNKVRIEDTVEGRDGTDVLKSVEGIIFGLEDFLSDNQNIDSLDVLHDNTLLQQAIDDFVTQTQSGAASDVQIDQAAPEFSIVHIDNLQNPLDIIA